MKLTTAAFILAFACTAPAQSGELVIGHVHLTLGMAKETVLVELNKEFEPKQVSAKEGKYLLWTKVAANELPRSAGSVSFEQGRLYRASKNWSDELASDETKMPSLFESLSQVAGSGGRSGRVRARTLRAEPIGNISGSEIRLITIDFPPDRQIEVQMNTELPAPGEKPFYPSTSVREVLTDVTHSK